MYRVFSIENAVHFPGFGQKNAFWKRFPDALLFEYPKDHKQLQRDFKWLRSYRYGIMHLGGENARDLRQRCEQASAMLGWPAPYLEDSREMNHEENSSAKELFAGKPVS